MRITMLLFPFLAGCSCDAGVGESCDSRDDCAEGLYCVSGRCSNEPGRDAGALPDAGQDAGPEPDSGPPGSIEEIPIDQEIEMPDLEAPADVVIDVYGIPHVYAESVHDATLAEGYMMASDRLIQMELGRRQASGTLTEIAGVVAPELIDEDIFMRVVGLRRQAQAVFDAVEPGSDMEAALEGYASGVNGFLARLRGGDERVPQALQLFLSPTALEDWSPVDSLVMGQLQSYMLGFEASYDVEVTDWFTTLRDTFSEDAEDPLVAARAGVALDLFRLRPSVLVSTRDGFPGGADLAVRPGKRGLTIPRVAAALEARARRANEIALRIARRWGRSADFGSNNWVVSGALTESGAAMMSNDTHLRLTNPPIFYQVHLSTKRGDAEAGLNLAGETFAGVPGVILGFNENVAWGATTAYADSTDVYLETLTAAAGGDPATVEFQGSQVEVELIPEDIPNAFGGVVHVEIEWVPHHGPLVPNIEDGHLLAHEGAEALSWRWTGFDALTDPTAQRVLEPFFGAAAARDVHELEAAWDDFSSAPHNWVAADTDGDILWTTKSHVPVRDPAAMTFDPATGEGIAPCFVLPGTGGAEWLGNLDLEYVPRDENPERGFIATANADPVGSNRDGNPFNGPRFVGWDYGESGTNRMARIVERLDELAAEGGIAIEDLQSVQADARSPLGARIVPFLVAAIERADEEASAPGTHADLAAVVAGASDRWDEVQSAKDRLAAWSFDAAAAAEGDPSGEEVSDSIAATIFNVTMVDLLPNVFGDELEAAGLDPWEDREVRTLLAMLEEPEELRALDDEGESVLWDDMTTKQLETRDAILVASLVEALEDVQGLVGDDQSQWLWGRLHTLRLRSSVPGFLPDIPAADDPTFPNGFPRHGDNFTVDASAPGFDLDFTFQSGPAIRTVVELVPGAVRARSVIPGGQSSDPESPHFADEMELWRRNETHPIHIYDEGVLETWERRIRLVPR
ncbi:MAG: penicillin acylase family protein [Deltaproteobacteria bacterium]|nr:penicillin acylase family protein [Deltaproteobacteria bacterium]